MARIRTIKPEFVESESIGKLGRDARLLFIQLWTFVDDVGRARASSRLLASRLYPYDTDAPKLIGHWLEELELGGHIRLYEVDGDQYLDIPKWLKHQKIDHPSKSRLPEFPEGFEKPREDERDNRASYLGPRTIVPRTLDLVPTADADDSIQVDALATWNETAERCGWPLAQKLSEPRKRSLKGRLEECGGLDGWRIALDKMAASPFFRSKWTPGFDWILKPANLTKVMEGNYDERASTEQGLGAVLAELGRIGSGGH